MLFLIAKIHETSLQRPKIDLLWFSSVIDYWLYLDLVIVLKHFLSQFGDLLFLFELAELLNGQS